MITKIRNGLVLTDNREIKTNVYIQDKEILSITNEELPFDKEIDAHGLYVAPGFIDIHIHGAAGYDFLDGTKEAYEKISEEVAKHGATAIVPTLTSSTKESMKTAISTFDEVKKNGTNGAKLLGIHLEGPYFAASQKGAQDENQIRDFDRAEYEEIASMSDSLLRWTAAPERTGAQEFGQYMTAKHVLPCIGHSDADSKTAQKAFENGFSHITHLYSCTSSVHRKNAFRYAGIVETAYLNDDISVEIIADGIHLPDDLLKLVYKIKGADKIALITDSMRGAGMPDGESILGGMSDGLKVIIEDGVAKLPDRSAFAGSVAFCDRLVKNMVKLAGVSLCDAVKMASETPANILGLDHIGKLSPGFAADIVLFDAEINIHKTIVDGEEVFSRE